MPNGRGVSAQRANRGGMGLDWPAALLPPVGGEAGAVEVALLWGDRLLDVRQFREGERATVGHLPQDSLHVFAKEIGAGFPVIRTDGEERILCVPRTARLAIFGAAPDSPAADEDALRECGRLRDAEDRPAWDVVFERGERAVFAVGDLRITVREVNPGARVKPVLIRGRDFSFIKFATVTALIAIAVLMVCALSESSDVLVDDSVFTGRAAATTIKVFKPEKPKPPPELALNASTSAPSEKSPTRHRRGGGKPDPKKLGLPGALADLLAQGGNVFRPGGLDHNIDAALDKLGKGGPLVSELGPGFTSRGGGNGGPGGGVFDIGGTGTLGGGGGGGGGEGRLHRIGIGTGEMRPHVTPSPEKTRIEGGLDKDQIAKVIRKHENEIKYCYESALHQEPGLQGKVAVMFTIDPAGAVADAQVAESTIGSATVEGCIVGRVRRWHFPEPRGGGVVSVNFPWLFRPAGAE